MTEQEAKLKMYEILVKEYPKLTKSAEVKKLLKDPTFEKVWTYYGKVQDSMIPFYGGLVTRGEKESRNTNRKPSTRENKHARVRAKRKTKHPVLGFGSIQS